MKRIAVTGGTGFIGGHLVRALAERGDRVTVLTRDAGRTRERVADGVEYVAFREGGDGGENSFEGLDGVVNLAGEPAVGRRWTPEKKEKILSSRVRTTEAVVRGIERARVRPKVLVSASGVGYYGALGGEPVDERGPPGSDFLARVTREWEGAAERAESLGARVVRARFGIVLGRGGGALVEMARPFRMFVGGPMGSGKQGFSWIHVDDAVNALLCALDDDALSGPVNVTAPKPVSNEEMSHTIGRVLGRPSALRAPAFALRALFGEGAEPLLTGQRALPGALEARGFQFRYADVEAALVEALS